MGDPVSLQSPRLVRRLALCLDPTCSFKPDRPVVIWRVDVVYLTKRDWKYETSKAAAGRGGRTHTFGVIHPADKLKDAVAYVLPGVVLRGGKPVLSDS